MSNYTRKTPVQAKGFFGWLADQMKAEEQPIRRNELHDMEGSVYDPMFGWRNVRRPVKKHNQELVDKDANIQKVDCR